MCLTGGKDNEIFRDFFKWASYFVEESRRKLKLETYTILGSYNPKLAQLQKMQLKHTWWQKPPKGQIHVPLPPNIGHRLEHKGKHAWPSLIADIDNMGRHLPELGSMVVEKNDSLTKDEKDKAAVKWASELEIAMISAQRTNWDTLEQEQELIPEFAGLIAGKLDELAKVAKINEEDEKIFKVTWGGDLMQLALEKFNDEAWRREYAAESNEGPAAKKQKAGPNLTTKVVLWDDGKQKTELQTFTAPRKENQVGDTPRTEWMGPSLGETYRDEKFAKHAFAQCCL